jgi:hypothetical protein
MANPEGNVINTGTINYRELKTIIGVELYNLKKPTRPM